MKINGINFKLIFYMSLKFCKILSFSFSQTSLNLPIPSFSNIFTSLLIFLGFLVLDFLISLAVLLEFFKQVYHLSLSRLISDSNSYFLSPRSTISKYLLSFSTEANSEQSLINIGNIIL